MSLAHIQEREADEADESAPAVEGRLLLALEALIARGSRAQGPEGDWIQGLWYPSPSERRPCCEGLLPTPGNKQALESHCRSAIHVAALFEVPVTDLRRAFRLARRAQDRNSSRPEIAPLARTATHTEVLVRVSRAARSEAFDDLRTKAREGASLIGALANLDEQAPADGVTRILQSARAWLHLTHESLENAAQMEMVFRVAETALERLRALEA